MKSRRHAGFTLLEVLVALSIFALLGVGAYRLLDSGITSHERLSDRQQQFNRLRLTFEKIERELLQVTDRPVRDNYGAMEPVFQGTMAGFVFTRSGWNNPRQLTRSNLQRVEYSISGSEDGQALNTLMRSSWTVLDRAQDTEPVLQTLLPDIEFLQFRYLDHEDNWHFQWPPLNSTQQTIPALPMGIEIELATAGQGRITRFMIPAITRMEEDKNAIH